MPRLDEQLNDVITTAANDELVPEPLDPFEDGNEVVPFCSDDEDDLDISSEMSETIMSENVNCRPRPPCSDDTVSQYSKKIMKQNCLSKRLKSTFLGKSFYILGRLKAS